MAKIKNIVGQRFGRLVVIARAPNGPHSTNYIQWFCLCDCGIEKIINGQNLRRGLTHSCGCFKQEKQTIHAESHSRTYQAWINMKARCRPNPENPFFKYYAARGIKFCARWDNSFVDFLTDMGGPCPPGMSLDRYPNNDGNYEPGNCRWATRKQQMNNTRNNHLITWRGETLTLRQWSERVGIKERTLLGRLENHWPIEEVFTVAIHSKRHKGLNSA